MTRLTLAESQARAVKRDLPGSGWVELLRVLAGSIVAGAR